MRDIKFRAWNPELNQMEYCAPSEYWAIFNDKDSIVWGLYHRRENRRILTGDPNAYLNTPGILMQYTGLKDKNGKEIYEGDVLSYFGDVCKNGEPKLGELEFRINEYEVGWVCTFPLGEGAGWTPNLYREQEQIEVIGNIYENPQLLK